ncbi:MAG: hypothetical protein GC162_05335 [Planctomycetes bacterium]|nr:hypothetical protein [Planctomycetota bacterium]
MAVPDRVHTDDCPFIDDDDARCRSHFTLDHLNEALSVCMGGYHGCATYWRLRREHPQRLIALTAHGQPLQPTGS